MNIASKLSISAVALAALLTTAAFAQEDGDRAPDQMMHDQTTMPGNMMNGDMDGMQDMMQMMQQMGPMMEACTEMMKAMTNQIESPVTEPQDG
jgi:3-hydroxyisobutyrate dehydrogenase-like beta-hydroxyacid dehydrogenase